MNYPDASPLKPLSPESGFFLREKLRLKQSAVLQTVAVCTQRADVLWIVVGMVAVPVVAVELTGVFWYKRAAFAMIFAMLAMRCLFSFGMLPLGLLMFVEAVVTTPAFVSVRSIANLLDLDWPTVSADAMPSARVHAGQDMNPLPHPD
jgi:hypothetical protein